MKDKLTTDEQALLRELLEEDSQIEVVVPASSSGEWLYGGLETCCKALNYLDRQSNRLKPIIGRMLLLIQKDPEIYRSRGYRNFEDFLLRGVCEAMQLSRSNLYEVKRLASKWPNLSLEKYEQLGPTKLNVLSKFTDQSCVNHEKYIDKALSMTATKFRSWAEEQKLIAEGEATPVVITIATTQDIASLWQSFVNDGRIQSYCGSASHGVILARLIQECSIEWMAQEREETWAPPPQEQRLENWSASLP
jgi:hypothetical protein